MKKFLIILTVIFTNCSTFEYFTVAYSSENFQDIYSSWPQPLFQSKCKKIIVRFDPESIYYINLTDSSKYFETSVFVGIKNGLEKAFNDLNNRCTNKSENILKIRVEFDKTLEPRYSFQNIINETLFGLSLTLIPLSTDYRYTVFFEDNGRKRVYHLGTFYSISVLNLLKFKRHTPMFESTFSDLGYSYYENENLYENVMR